MSDGRKPTDDDETTSQRDHLPRAPILPANPPVKHAPPAMGRVSTRKGVTAPTPLQSIPDEDDARMDDGPTMIDPEVPTGARRRPRSFDPNARIDDNRRTEQRSASPPVIVEDETSEATVPKGVAPITTVVAKPRANPKPKGPVAPRIEPVPPLDPSELPAQPKQRGASSFDPYARIDDTSRTNKWDAANNPANEAAPPLRESGPPTNPLPERGELKMQLPLPPVLPLAPGPRSEPLRVVSMKTPAEIEEEKAARPLPAVRLRTMGDVRQQTPPRGMGVLAPPYDPQEARSRKRRDLIIWGSVAVIVAAVVMLAVWFLAR